jgi:FtsZ-binding cell division protein ZapB
MKELYKKYINWIVVILFCLWGLKSCQTCSKQRQLDYNSVKYEKTIDSLNYEIHTLNDLIKSQKDSLSIYQIQIDNLNEKNQILNNVNKHFQNTNKVLINTNKNLSNKEEK